ncbi:MAG: hypothetical protein ABI832_11430 [bacterium]
MRRGADASSNIQDTAEFASCALTLSDRPFQELRRAPGFAPSGIGTIAFGLAEKRLAGSTGDDPENLTMDLDCRSVFAAGRRPVEVRGPFAELEGEIVEGHASLW